MPAGDPAGYLPSVKRARSRSYKPRAKRGMKTVSPSIGKLPPVKPTAFASPAMTRPATNKRRRYFARKGA